MSDVMLFGVLRMPYALAMSTELSRRQFYDRVQDALDEIERLRALDIERMIADCVPGGDLCDPQSVADALREWARRADVDAVGHVARQSWTAAMTDTPLTDAQLVRVYGRTGTVCTATPSSGHPTYVPAEFARAQERQIAALGKVVQAYRALSDNAEEWECDGLGMWAQHGWWEAVDDAMEALAPNVEAHRLP